MLNCIVIMGRLVADPELRTTPSGINRTTFRVAVDRRYQKAGEEKQTDFINCVAWRQTADFVAQYFHKGSMIAVQGSLQTRTYEDNTGAKRSAFDVVADNVSFCGSKAESGAGGYGAGAPVGNYGGQATPSAPAASYANSTPEDFSQVVDDDLPF